MKFFSGRLIKVFTVFFVTISLISCGSVSHTLQRERISINENWQFRKYESRNDADNLIYNVRPTLGEYDDSQDADTEPEDAVKIEADRRVLKPWIMSSGNDFIKDPVQRYERPDGNPGDDFPFIQYRFDDSSWETVTLPHDWAINGPFMEGWNAKVTGGMGRLPSPGVAWYRKKLEIPASDAGKRIFLDVDGAMSYAIVWLNGNLMGGWPFSYSSWRLDLTTYIKPGGKNQLAIRLDNPQESSRWYPGGGIYRNVWLTKTNPVHVGHWGTYLTTPEVSEESANISLEFKVGNDIERLSLQASYHLEAKKSGA